MKDLTKIYDSLSKKQKEQFSELIIYLKKNRIYYYKLKKFEKKKIMNMIKQGKIDYIEFNKRVHLIFRLKYPWIPTVVSIITVIISIFTLLCVYICKS